MDRVKARAIVYDRQKSACLIDMGKNGVMARRGIEQRKLPMYWHDMYVLSAMRVLLSEEQAEWHEEATYMQWRKRVVQVCMIIACFPTTGGDDTVAQLHA